jgi:hypothetical protein
MPVHTTTPDQTHVVGLDPEAIAPLVRGAEVHRAAARQIPDRNPGRAGIDERAREAGNPDRALPPAHSIVRGSLT